MSNFPTRPGQPGRSDPVHEDKCRRCGVSCHLAVPHGEEAIVFPGLHCRYLDRQPDGRFLCSVYEDRFEIAPWCHHADIAAELGLLAVDCPYSVDKGAPQGKLKLSEQALDRIWPELLGRVQAWGVPTFVDREALIREVVAREGVSWELVPWPGDSSRLLLRPLTP